MSSSYEVLGLLAEILASSPARQAAKACLLGHHLANVVLAEKSAESWKQIHLILSDPKVEIPDVLLQKIKTLDSRLNVSKLPPALLSLAYVSFSEVGQAFRWLTEPNVNFEFKTPCEYAKLSDSGFFSVDQYLRMVKARAI